MSYSHHKLGLSHHGASPHDLQPNPVPARHVVTGTRANRISKGAAGLPMEVKDTPQAISTIDKEEMADFGATSSNEALRLGTGINVEQYETNRAVFNARGFEMQLTHGLPVLATARVPVCGQRVPRARVGPRAPSSGGEQTLTRFYAASRAALTDELKAIVGLNAIQLKREGSSIHGNTAATNSYPKTQEVSPYLGFTYDFTNQVLDYVSYSQIFQNQDQTDIAGAYQAAHG